MELWTLSAIQIYSLFYFNSLRWTPVFLFASISPRAIRHIQYLYDSVAIVIESFTQSSQRETRNILKSIEIVGTKPTHSFQSQEQDRIAKNNTFMHDDTIHTEHSS